jgi:hypothetical protein
MALPLTRTFIAPEPIPPARTNQVEGQMFLYGEQYVVHRP